MTVNCRPTARFLKIVLLVSVILHQFCSLGRFLLLYRRLKEEAKNNFDYGLAMFFVLIFVLPFVCTGFIFGMLHIYATYREIKEDLLWFRFWFNRMFVLFMLELWLHMFWLLFYQLVSYIHDDTGPYRTAVDVTDVIICSLMNGLFNVILFRPLLVRKDLRNRDRQVGYSVSEHNAGATFSAAVVTVDVAQTNREETATERRCCSMTAYFSCSLICTIMYMTGRAVMILYMII